ncbi:hypothetical protein [Salinispora arenicola]|uniref:hypothetical protein n=1 Tax=Salinispora arenicola TaxID=168697 RepID=UPI00037B36A0|nr:hypothetical protein [Salinispora arenicola]
MIPKITYGSRVRGLLEYLWGPGKTEEHVNPHLVAGCDDVELLAPQQRKQVPGFVDQAHTPAAYAVSVVNDYAADQSPADNRADAPAGGERHTFDGEARHVDLDSAIFARKEHRRLGDAAGATADVRAASYGSGNRICATGTAAQDGADQVCRTMGGATPETAAPRHPVFPRQLHYGYDTGLLVAPLRGAVTARHCRCARLRCRSGRYTDDHRVCLSDLEDSPWG